MEKKVKELANDLVEGFDTYHYSVDDICDILYRIMYETKMTIDELWEMNNNDSTLMYHYLWLFC